MPSQGKITKCWHLSMGSYERTHTETDSIPDVKILHTKHALLLLLHRVLAQARVILSDTLRFAACCAFPVSVGGLLKMERCGLEVKTTDAQGGKSIES